MTSGHRRKITLFTLIALDFVILLCATGWVLKHGPAGSLGLGRSSGFLAEGPGYVLCGAADQQGNAWVGSEDQGVWQQTKKGWRHFGSADGLADDDACAVACDGVGRIWVGHGSHGISIYNGKEWKTYDSFSGVGGSRVFCIATCPTDGDVWIGTDCGLTRYSLQHDTWTSYNRGSGLAADQASSMAFDPAGNIFVGLQADGIAMAKAAEGYANWTSVIGPDDVPIVQSGPGLPSRLVNAVMVTSDGTVYAGTCRGLARSNDDGATWSFLRGANWPQLARGRYDGVPADFNPTADTPLLEDWITSLAQDSGGVMWIGYRNAGFQSFGSSPVKMTKNQVTTLVPIAGVGCLVGTYGQGAMTCDTGYTMSVPAPTPMASQVPGDQFPTPAGAPDTAELASLQQAVKALPAGKDGIDFLGDDWTTCGDWCGRYGSAIVNLAGYETYDQHPGYSIDQTTGPWGKSSMFFSQDDGIKGLALHRCLLNSKGERIANEINDGSFRLNKFPAWKEGPDVYSVVTVPAGVHRISLYFQNADGHKPDNMDRDFYLQVKKVSILDAVGSADTLASERPGGVEPPDAVKPELAPTLARARVPRYWLGVYKQFITRGAGTYWFKVGRNNSHCTKLQGIFVDRLDKPIPFKASYPHPSAATDYTGALDEKGQAAQLWAALDAAVGQAGYSAIATRARIAAYRAAAAGGADDATLASWRRQLPAWDEADHAQFDDYVKTLPGGQP